MFIFPKSISITSKNSRTFSAVFALIGLIFFFPFVSTLASQRQFISNSIKTEGIVVEDIVYEEDSYKHRVQYTNNEGEIFEHITFAQKPKFLEVGERVEILYNPNNPSDSIVNKNIYLYLSTVIFAFISAAFLFISLFFLYTSNPKKSEKAGSLEGLSAAKIISICFSICGILLIFLGSGEWLNNASVSLFGSGFILFGIFLYLSEKFKSDK